MKMWEDNGMGLVKYIYKPFPICNLATIDRASAIKLTLVEHSTVNRKVVGSNPPIVTNPTPLGVNSPFQNGGTLNPTRQFFKHL